MGEGGRDFFLPQEETLAPFSGNEGFFGAETACPKFPKRFRSAGNSVKKMAGDFLLCASRLVSVHFEMGNKERKAGVAERWQIKRKGGGMETDKSFKSYNPRETRF